MASRDWFAPAEPVIRLGGKVDGERDDAVGSFLGAGKAGLGVYGNGVQSAVPLQQQFQTPTSRGTTATKGVDGFEIVSTGYYFQNEGNWDRGGPKSRA